MIWTKPDDLEFDPIHPLAGLGTIGRDGFWVGTAEGRPHLLRKGMEAETFRRLVLRCDGLPINPDNL